MAPMTRRQRLSGFLVGVALSVSPLLSQGPALDRVLAVVDDDPILASDVAVTIGLSLVVAEAGEGEVSLHRRALDALIEQRLRFHQVDRYGFSELPVEEISKRHAELITQFASPELYHQRLRELGITDEVVRQLVAQRLMVLTYVEERLGARVFVGLDEIKNYYDTTLTAEMQRAGTPLPPIEEVRERIRSVLKEQRLNQELRTWTEELRRDADIADHFDASHAELPPVR